MAFPHWRLAEQMNASTRRFALTATDRYLPILEAFVAGGWTPVKLFTVPTDERLHSNRRVVARAQELGIPIQLSRLTDADLTDLGKMQCDLLVVASYPWRIGDWRPHIPHAVNFHPSPLPRYRGPLPQVWAILDQQRRWGVSCHKLEQAFDSGAILAQHDFDLGERECFDVLDMKIQMSMRELACTVANDFDQLWRDAQPQLNEHYVGFWSEADRTLDFTQSYEMIDRQLRAFGQHECLATINDVAIHVRRAITWPEAHTARLGSVVHADGLRMVIACRGGYTAILDWAFFSAEAITGTPNSA